MLSCCGRSKEDDDVVDPEKEKNAFRQPIGDGADAIAQFNKEKQKRKDERIREGIVNNVDTEDEDEESPEQIKARKVKEAEEHKAKAVLTIQSTIRMFLGKCKRKVAYHEALGDLEEWLEEKNKWLAYEGKRRGAIITARKGFILKYINALFSGAVAFFTETDAVLTIQRLWRGHSSRMKYPFIKKIKIKLIKYEPRYGPEVYRRLWARRHFEPEGGWRVDKRTPYYDMWSHIDKPPKGESYGIRSHKVLANDTSPTGVQRLTGDKNSWVGFQTALLTDEELAPKLNESQKRLLMSPLAHRAKKKRIVQVVPEVPEDQKADAFFEKVRREKALERMQKRAEWAVTAASRKGRRGMRDSKSSHVNPSMSVEGTSFSEFDIELNDSNVFNDSKFDVNITHENEKIPEVDWGNDDSRDGYWTKKFKRLFVTPLRGSRKPTPFTHKAAQAAAVPHEIKSRKKSKEKSLPLSHSIGVTSRMLINSILSSTEGRENKFGTMEASKRISVKNLVSYEKAQNVLKDTRISEHAMTFDHGKAMIEEQKRRAIARKTGGTEFMELPKDWRHENKDEVGAKIGYIRYDTQERWDLGYDDFGREFYINSVTQESSWEPPQNPALSNEEDNTTIPSNQLDHSVEEDEDELSPIQTDVSTSTTSQKRSSIARRTSSFMGTKNVGHKSPKPKPQPFGRKIGETLKHYQEGKQPDIDFLHDSSHATPYLALNQHGHVDDGSTIFSPSSPSNKKGGGKKKMKKPRMYDPSNFNPDSGSDDDSSTGGPLLLLDPEAFKITDRDTLEETNTYKNTPWARLKDSTLHLVERANQLAQTKDQENFELNVPIKQKKIIQGKVKTWKSKPKSNFYFKHTWLPQPLVSEAAKDIHKSPEKMLQGEQNDNYQGGPSSPSIHSTNSSPYAMIPGGTSLAFEDSMTFDQNHHISSLVGASTSASHFNYLKSNTYNKGDESVILKQTQKPKIVKTQSRFKRFMNRYVYQKSVEQRDKKELHSFAFK